MFARAQVTCTAALQTAAEQRRASHTAHHVPSPPAHPDAAKVVAATAAAVKMEVGDRQRRCGEMAVGSTEATAAPAVTMAAVAAVVVVADAALWAGVGTAERGGCGAGGVVGRRWQIAMAAAVVIAAMAAAAKVTMEAAAAVTAMAAAAVAATAVAATTVAAASTVQHGDGDGGDSQNCSSGKWRRRGRRWRRRR